jgi:hypothetical protein
MRTLAVARVALALLALLTSPSVIIDNPCRVLSDPDLIDIWSCQ